MSSAATIDATVVLVGGPPGAGKSTLGRRLAQRLGYGALSVDDLAAAMRSVTDAARHPGLFLQPDGHLRYFTDSSPDQLIADALRQEEVLWPAVERVIRTRLGKGDGVVIDGWLLSPEKVHGLASDQVAAVWIHIDEEALDRRERRVESFREGSDDPERMHANFMARSLWRNRVVAEEARRLGMPVIEQPGSVAVDDLVDLALAALAPAEGS